ncbi:lytic transglycosylase domain-containing protein [Streptomyces sp. Da 82-17]|uniref:lytic transglycosylase domain-containing protein n=1 Tax=Streptomyces sp. Da 82-17 TaxID=3377116 RepID=UPI0038D427CA
MPSRTRRLRRALRGTTLAVAATVALTASQAPYVSRELSGSDEGRAGAGGDPYPGVGASQGDDSYHTELPPLGTRAGPGGGEPTAPPARTRAESGIPATVLAAYRRAEASVARTDPACRLPWQLLAAIGKVESGQARGGDVDAHGTTRQRITGPPLNGDGFALIRDTEGGAWDGDAVYDRAVGPMQFLPGTWRRWGTDGNGDGRADPNNIHDAALAAGHYLCAGPRDLSVRADLERAVLSYNYSRAYLQLVLHWLEFYRRGVHEVPDGTGVRPRSPGAGSDTPATEPVGGGGGSGGSGGGIVIGPTPGGDGPTPGPGPRPRPRPSESPGPGPTQSPAPDPTPGPDPAPDPDPDPTGGPSPDPTTPSPGPCPTDSESPSPPPTEPPTEPSPDPSEPAPSPSPCATPTA